MKKFFPVILLIASLTLSACGPTKNENGTTNNVDTKNAQETGKTEMKSLKDLFALGSAQKCTFEVKDEDEVVTKSEIVVNGKKFKQVTEMTTEDGVSKIYSVSDGVYFYSWNDKIKDSGMKMKLEEMENSGETATTDQKAMEGEGQAVSNINEKFDYKCIPATLSESDLAVPTDINFVDFSEMMKGLQNMDMEELQKLAPQE
ncbi:MAG TPA: hypothetical protein VN174_03535 [Candidatus Methanoperedens sp.]|nr:hypothetical protein [Candidatus Methanoperedens sp.]